MTEISMGVKVWGDVTELITGMNKGGKGVDEFASRSGGKFAELSRAFQKAGLIYKNVAAEMGPNSPEAKAALKNFQNLKDHAEKITGSMKPKAGMFSGLSGELAGVAAGYLGVTAVAGGLFSFFKGAVEGAAGDERAEKRLANSLQGTGKAYDNLIAYKEQMMQSTLFSEDEIMGAITMGAELGRTEEQTKKMVETAMGLSNVTGMDLNTAMMQLSATFDGNIGKLGKLSPALKDLTDKQLANGEGVNILNEKFGKLATEGLTTVEGRVAQAKKKFEELSDSVGATILSILGFKAIEDNSASGKQNKKEQEDIAAFIKMGKEERKAYIAGWQTEQDNYYAMLQKAKKDQQSSAPVVSVTDDPSAPVTDPTKKNREHYVTLFSDTKFFLDKLKAINSQSTKNTTKETKSELDKRENEWKNFVAGVEKISAEQGRAYEDAVKNQSVLDKSTNELKLKYGIGTADELLKLEMAKTTDSAEFAMLTASEKAVAIKKIYKDALGSISKVQPMMSTPISGEDPSTTFQPDAIPTIPGSTTTVVPQIPAIPKVSLGTTNMDDLKTAISEATAALAGFGAGFQRTFAAIGNIIIKFKEGFKGGWKEATGAALELAAGAVEMISGLFSQASQQRIQEFEDQYTAQRESIENSKMSESGKKKALDKLDAESAKKRKQLMRDQAKDQKTAAVMQAIISGALAVVSALTIPVVGIALAIIVGALAAVQIAAIIAQPLPALAGGGLAMAPTLALVGDNVNARIDPEVIAPLSKLREMMFGGGQMQESELTAKVRGDDLLFVLNRAKINQNRRY